MKIKYIMQKNIIAIMKNIMIKENLIITNTVKFVIKMDTVLENVN